MRAAGDSYDKSACCKLQQALLMSALPIFPVSHPTSIVSDHELNFCVRYGNRWTLMAINTDLVKKKPDQKIRFLYVGTTYFSGQSPGKYFRRM